MPLIRIRVSINAIAGNCGGSASLWLGIVLDIATREACQLGLVGEQLAVQNVTASFSQSARDRSRSPTVRRSA